MRSAQQRSRLQKALTPVSTMNHREWFQGLLEHAVMAPSGHNTQPWLFRPGRDSMDLIADRSRSLPVVDPFDRELTISCGAALHHVETAARHSGRALDVELCPEEGNPDVLVRMRPGVEIPSQPSSLFDAIPRRRTTRSLFDDRLLPDTLITACENSAQDAGVQLSIVTDAQQRLELGKLVAKGDRIQFSDPRFRRELAFWVRSRHCSSRAGMSGKGFGMPDILSPVGATVIRTFDLGNQIASGDEKKIIEGSPTLALLSSKEDSVHDWLQTGRALSRILLTLAAEGATASYLNPPVELEELRSTLPDLVACERFPQILLRVGYGPAASPTVRRNVSDVIIT